MEPTSTRVQAYVRHCSETEAWNTQYIQEPCVLCLQMLFHSFFFLFIYPYPCTLYIYLFFYFLSVSSSQAFPSLCCCDSWIDPFTKNVFYLSLSPIKACFKRQGDGSNVLVSLLDISLVKTYLTCYQEWATSKLPLNNPHCKCKSCTITYEIDT